MERWVDETIAIVIHKGWWAKARNYPANPSVFFSSNQTVHEEFGAILSNAGFLYQYEGKWCVSIGQPMQQPFIHTFADLEVARNFVLEHLRTCTRKEG